MTIDLPFIWAGIIAFAVMAYVVLDGFDLGIGMLFPFASREDERDAMMNSVAPVWDGNETWLVMGGGGLYATFPLAFAIIMPAIYAPVIAMLLGLAFRGVAFEFRGRTQRSKRVWDWAFAGGSFIAAFSQGVALGALVQGVPVQNGAYAGGWWDWATGFSVLTGAAVVIGYGLLGATWLVWKTEGSVQSLAYAAIRLLGPGTVLLIGLVSLITPFLSQAYWERWFDWPQILLALPVPLAVLGAAWSLYASVRDGRELAPFLSALALFVLCFIGLGISFYPYIVPNSVTIWQAASPDNSLSFLLVGALALLPLILIYTGYSYWVFRGKVTSAGGYH